MKTRSAPYRLRALILTVLAWLPALVQAQTIDDAVLMRKGRMGIGATYAHESWDHYWEGALKRENGNIGTLTTQSVMGNLCYGVTDALSVMAMLPYVWTEASQGTLSGLDGLQDVTFAAKYRILSTPFTEQGTFRALLVGAAGIPVSDYSPDFQPLSIGLGSRRVSTRLTLNFQAHDGWFVNGSAAHTWRGNVDLDRSAYYTDGQLYLTNEVKMPAVFDYSISAGFKKGRLFVPISLTEQRTLGGGDIRRQDMPFVSNRMNFVKLDAAVSYSLPQDLIVRVGASRILSGRNVGEATGLNAGLLYTIQL